MLVFPPPPDGRQRIFLRDEPYDQQIAWIDNMIERLEKWKFRLNKKQITLMAKRKRKEIENKRFGLRLNS